MNKAQAQADIQRAEAKRLLNSAWDAAVTACAELLESEARKLADTADACWDIPTRLGIMTEQETMLRAAIMVRSRSNAAVHRRGPDSNE